MKYCLALIAFLVCHGAFADVFGYGGNPCQNSDGTILSASGVTSGTSPTQIIAGITGKQTYICGMQVQGVSGTNPTFTLVTGTGTNCGTGTAAITPAFATPANTLEVFTSPVHKVGPGLSLCYQGGGSTPVANFLMTYISQ